MTEEIHSSMADPQRANGTRSSVVRLAMYLGLGALLFWLVVRGQDVRLIREKLTHARWGWAALGLLFAVASNVFRAARWNLLIHPLGDRPRLINTFGAVSVGYMANLAFPRLGEVTRCVILYRYEKTPLDKLLGTVLTERIIDVLTILLFLGLVVLLAFDRLAAVTMEYVVDPIASRVEPLSRQGPWLLVVVGVLAVLAIVGIRMSWGRFVRSRYLARLAGAVRGFMTGAQTVRHIEQPALFAIYTLLIWSMYAVMAWVCFFAFPATLGLGLTPALAILVFGGIGWAAPVQGGLGTFEIVVTPALVAFGVPASDALAYAILYHAAQVMGMLMFGLVALVTLPVINRRAA